MIDFQIAKCSDDQRSAILKLYNTNEAKLQENVKIIQNWIKTQPHIPDMPDASVIVNFLIMNKFRLDKVQKRIGFYYVIRSLLPDIFNMHPNNPEILRCLKSFDYLPLQDLTPDLRRVICFRLTDEANDVFDPLPYVAYTMLLTEIRLREDFRLEDVYVYDMKNVKFSHLAKLTPTLIKKLTIILKKLYNDSDTSINLINVAPFAYSFMNMLKSLNPPKVQERFVIHENLESLYNCIPKENLPNEYGGNAGSMQEIKEKWMKKMEEYDPIFKHLRSLKIDKDLLPENLKIDDHFGVHGNFKKLEVD